MKAHSLPPVAFAFCVGAMTSGAVQAHAISWSQDTLRFHLGLVRSLPLGASAGGQPTRGELVAQAATRAPAPKLALTRTLGRDTQDDTQNDTHSIERELLGNARQWIERGRLDLARQNVEKLLALNPDLPQALAELGNLALQEKRPQEAGRLLDRLHQHHPGSQAEHDLQTLIRVYGKDQDELARMRLLARAGREKEAADVARQLFPDGPPQAGTLSIEYYRILAAADAAGGHAQDASGIRSALDTAYARTGDANYRLLELEMRQAQGAPALALAQALEQLADSPGVEHQRLRDLWRRVLNRMPANAQGVAHLQAYLQRYPGDADVADLLKTRRATLQRAERWAHDPARLALVAAQKSLDAGDLDRAQTEAQTALRLRPHDADALGLLGLVRLRQARYDEAQPLFADAARRANLQKWRDLQSTARFWGLLQQADQASDAGRLDNAADLASQALRLQPHNPEALVTLAHIRVRQKQDALAEPLFRQALSAEPGHHGALRGLVALEMRAGRFDAAQALLATPATDKDDRALHAELRSSILAAQADALLTKERLGPALRLLEDAVALTPKDPWLRHRLARTYLQLHQPREASQVMDEGVSLAGHDPDMRFARALIRSAANDDAGALQDLKHIAVKDRSDAMRSLLRASSVRTSVAEAGGTRADVQQLLAHAEQQAGDDPDLLWVVANAWFSRSEPARGVAVFDHLAERLGGEAQLPASARLDHVALLARARMDARLGTLLPTLQAASGWDAAQTRRLAQLTAEHLERTIEARMAAGDRPGALALAHAPWWGESGLPAQEADLARARLLLAAEDWRAAEPVLQAVLAAEPDNTEAHLALGNALARQGRRDAAYAQALWLGEHVPMSEQDDQLALLRLLQRIPAMDAARTLARRLLQAYPHDTPVLLHAARLERAEDRYVQALAYFRQANAQAGNAPETSTAIVQDIAAIEARRQAWIEAGLVRIGKSSTPGISSLHGYELPVVAWMPKGYDGNYFLHVDRVGLDAGALPSAQADALEYGQVAAWPASAYPTQPGTPRGQGTNLGFGYRGTGVEWDVGAIGIGMPVTNVVGGVSWGQWREDGNYHVELSRRPLTGSLLSYAGARDPVTGQIWGGVVATGISARIGRPFGAWSASLSGGYALLQGKNVQDNTRLQLRAAIDRDVWRTPDDSINAGLALSLWRYGKDLSEYTWGHGGYYSPRNYAALSLPIEWGGRRGRFTWQLRGALSLSRSSSAATDYFPGSPALQAQALALGNGPLYGASASSGFGRSLRGIVEYRVTPNLTLGAQLSLDRSAYYAPTTALVYLRWMIDPVRALQPDRPRPVQPYSDF